MYFRVELAGVPIGLSVIYDRTYETFEEYVTEEEPAFSLEVTGDALREERLLTMRYRERKIPGDYPRTPEALEEQWLYHRIAERLQEYDILLFHGSAIAVDGKAYLFVAPSGAGKSTHARLWKEYFRDRAVMINDDKVFVRNGADGIFACGSPWMGKHRLGCNISRELTAIALLSANPVNSVTPVSLETAFPRLLRQCYHTTERDGFQHMMDLLEKVGSLVPLYELKCNMDPDAARVSYEGMTKDET